MSSVPRNTSSTDPKLLRARVFIGNLATEKVKREDLTEAFERYGEVIGCSLLRGYGFVQFLSEDDARSAVSGENGKMMKGAVMDVRMAAEGKRSAVAERQVEEPPLPPLPPPPPAREKESSSKRESSSKKSRRRSRSPRRSRWDPVPAPSHHPTPAHHPPPPVHHPPPSAHQHNYYSAESYPPPHEKYPPMESYPPPQPYRDGYHDYYYDKSAPPVHHGRRHSPPPPATHHPAYPAGEWEREARQLPSPAGRQPPPARQPPAAMQPPSGAMQPPTAARQPPSATGWEQEEHMRQRRHHSPPRASSPRPQWYRQSPPRSDWHRPVSPRQQVPPRSPRQQAPPRQESKVDMEIIVINKQQMDYANMVSRRVQDLGLKVSTKALAPTASLSELLDNIAKKGLLYAVIITSQHEVHGSLTLTILYGRNPQEHKNMPLEDALGLINRDFSRYCQAVREGHMRQQSKGPDLSAAIGSGGSDLTLEQISSVIDNLQQKKHELLKKQAVPFGVGGVSSIQQQQADLQAKILSLLGSNAVVPPSTRPMPAPQPSRDYWGPY